jgi:PST family polysaccharide transporter
MFVARLLTPEDYGLVGMATAFLGLVTMINEFGIGSAIVTLQKLSEEQVAQTNGLSVAFGACGFFFAVAAATPLSQFYEAPQLVWVILAMSTSFLTLSLRSVPFALLQRDMRFKTLALMEGGQAILQSLSMVLFAFIGLGYWTLVLGWLVGSVLSTAMAVTMRPHRLARPKVADLKEVFLFSGHVVICRLCSYIYSNADFVVAGKLLGRTSLGNYSYAWTLANLPIEKVTALVGHVTPAFFASVQNDRQGTQRYLLKVTELLGIVTIPASWGLALLAPEFILFALGEKWQAVVPPLQILGAWAAFRSITPPLSQVLFAIGESRFAMRTTLVGVAVMPLLFSVGSLWGTEGIAMAWVVGYPVLAGPMYWKVFRCLKLSPGSYMKSIWPALHGSMVMVALVLVIDISMPLEWSTLSRLGMKFGCGAVAYLVTLFCFHRKHTGVMYRFIRGISPSEV